MPTLTIAVSTYNRVAALAYARTYWDRIATDGCICVDGWPSWKVLPIDTTFRHFVKAGEEGEDAVGPKNAVLIPWKDLEDCTHFLSCCLGTPPGDPAGGLPVPQEVTTAQSPNPPYGCVGASTLVNWLLGQPNIAQVIANETNDPSYIDQLVAGDFIAYHDGNGYHHTALYLGNGIIACHTVCRSDDPECTWDASWDLGVGYNTWTFLRLIDAPASVARVSPAAANRRAEVPR